MCRDNITEIAEDGDKLILKFECEYGIVSLPFDNLDEIAKLKEDLGKAIYIFQHKDIFY